MPAVTLQGGSRNQYLPEDPTCIQTHNMTSKTARRSNNLSFSFPVVQICCVQFSSSPSGGRGRRSRFSAEAWNAAQQQMAHLPRLSWASPWESNFFRKQTAHLPWFSWASPWESIFLERKKKEEMFSCSLSTVEPFQCTSTRSIFSTRARLLGNKRSHQVCSCQLILRPLVNTHRLAAWTLNCSSVLVNTYIHARMDHVGVYRKTERQIWWTPLTTTIYITYVQTTAKNLLFLYKYQVTKYQQTKSVVAQRKTTCVSQHSSTWCIDASRTRYLHVNLHGVHEILRFGFCNYKIQRSDRRTY